MLFPVRDDLDLRKCDQRSTYKLVPQWSFFGPQRILLIRCARRCWSVC